MKSAKKMQVQIPLEMVMEMLGTIMIRQSFIIELYILYLFAGADSDSRTNDMYQFNPETR
jgi:hypothetical protein